MKVKLSSSVKIGSLYFKKCLRCGHEWSSKKQYPKCCAKCKSSYWDVPRKVQAGAGSGHTEPQEAGQE